MRNLAWISPALALALVIGCGGTAGTATLLAPASDPTCATIALKTQATTKQDNRTELLKSGAEVPETTIAYTKDDGIIAHTNHLISANQTGETRAQGPTGLTPVLVRTAYGIPSNLGSGAIAIVDAFHYPTSLADFNVFATQFGLPTEPSSNPTSTNAVFQVVFAAGVQPTTDTGWSQEMAIDTQWAHAMAPNAKIYLVEAKSSAIADLMAAVVVAKSLPGVKQVSMSFGSAESACNCVHYDPNLVQTGVVFFAASGDTSGQLLFPSLSKNAISVGGTSLHVDSAGNRTLENVWKLTGGGKSTVEPRPAFQNSAVGTTSTFRTGCDISAVGDPATGVSVYDSIPSGGFSGWITFGGTSVSCPIVAGIVNAAGVTFTSSQTFGAALYSLLGTTEINDVIHGTSGANSADHGYDFASGVGSPNGIAGL